MRPGDFFAGTRIEALLNSSSDWNGVPKSAFRSRAVVAYRDDAVTRRD
jgi:hypothetical protein